MLETHPFGDFVPVGSKYFLLGSFTAKPVAGYDWFYGSKRNQFWAIIERVYGKPLTRTDDKQELFREIRLAVGDIIYQCERGKGTSADNNLINIVYNIEGIKKILNENKIEKIFFSSRYVEGLFRKLFKDVEIEMVTLPSPSPRYARLSLVEKVARYKELLPKLKT